MARKTIKPTFTKPAQPSTEEQLKAIATKVLPGLEALCASPMLAMLPLTVAMLKKEISVMDAGDARTMLAGFGMSADEDDKQEFLAAIREKVKAAHSTDVETEIQKARDMRQILTSIDREAQVSFAKATDDLMPPRFKAFMEDVMLAKGMSAEQTVERALRVLSTKSDLQVALSKVKKAELMPVALIAEKAEKVFLETSDEQIFSIVQEFARAVSTQDVVDTVNHGLNFIEEALTNALHDKVFTAAYSDAGTKFAASAGRVLTVLEDAVANAQIVPDLSDVRVAVRTANEKSGVYKPGRTRKSSGPQLG